MNGFVNKIKRANDDCDDLIAKLATAFHEDFIQPICETHKLRFWSGNGTWFFESPSGRQIDVEEKLLRWGHATGNVHMTTRGYEVSCVDDDIPEFFRALREIEAFLISDVMGSPLGYSVSDFQTDMPYTRELSFAERIAI